LGGNGAGQESISGYKALADSEGFIAVWANGIDAAWNIGPCCTTSRTVDDLGFAKAIVADVKSRACIDPKRVYATGYSMGGGMSHYLACKAADIFAAVVPAAFDLLTEDEEPCKPARPITVMSFRGTADPLVPYAGGASKPPSGLDVTIHFLGAEGTLKKWGELDGCTGTPTDTGNGCQAYTQCKEGVEVTLCTAQGGSHVPGDANLGWAMMKKHPMP
jgi:polyhydroxybutyrate depolymerase